MDKAVSGFLSIFFSLAGLFSFANAQSGPFDGITVIELADEIGENAIRGKEDPPSADSGQYIVTFVSKRGSYAALVGRQRGCVAWAAEGSNCDQLRRAHGMDWRIDKGHDLSPWGCSLIMEINGSQESGGVSGYRAQALSGVCDGT